METLPNQTAPVVPVATKMPVSQGWFSVFWAMLVACFAIILLVGLEPICFDSCAPLGPLNFILIAIPSVVVALAALLVHRGLRSNSTVAKTVLVLAGVFLAYVVLSLVV